MIVVVFVAHGAGRRAEFVLRGVGIIIVLAGLAQIQAVGTANTAITSNLFTL